ncbi:MULTISPECIES: helix-turn-helix domain-containing protein [unclassified Nocardioides]|uniref:helix-turn-helix domain-containing protein n=1 Tax=unclassified Nocardioides TaxID=2615069 RepID=UPI0030154D4B
MRSSTEPLATTAEVADYLNKPTSWVHDNAARLDLPRFKVGNQYRYRLSEIAEWVETRRKTLASAHG